MSKTKDKSMKISKYEISSLVIIACLIVILFLGLII
jgi:hypothetical protein